MRKAAAAARPVKASGVAATSVWSSEPVCRNAAPKSWWYVVTGLCPVATSTSAATRKAKITEPTGTATTSQRGCRSLRSIVTGFRARMRSGAARRGGALRRPQSRALALAGGAPDDALHEPVHPVEAVGAALQDLHPHASLDAQLALLVVERTGELVEGTALELLVVARDQRLRLRRDARPVGGELREAVVDRAVVEARLPGPV